MTATAPHKDGSGVVVPVLQEFALAFREVMSDPGRTLRFAGMPTLVMSHNKTLAAQLDSELKSFFPHNAVEYFVSYYDYYQPEAYIPQRDIYIEKDASINEEIDRLRLSATSALVRMLSSNSLS